MTDPRDPFEPDIRPPKIVTHTPREIPEAKKAYPTTERRMRAIDHVQDNETTGEFIERVLHEYLAGRADVVQEAVEGWIDALKLPWWVPSFVVKKALRWAYPDQVIALVMGLLGRAGLE